MTIYPSRYSIHLVLILYFLEIICQNIEQRFSFSVCCQQFFDCVLHNKTNIYQPTVSYYQIKSTHPVVWRTLKFSCKIVLTSLTVGKINCSSIIYCFSDFTIQNLFLTSRHTCYHQWVFEGLLSMMKVCKISTYFMGKTPLVKPHVGLIHSEIALLHVMYIVRCVFNDY